MTSLTMPTAFENVEKAGKIGVEISVRVLQRIANTGLRGQMHHRPELALGKNAFDRAALGEIDLLESKFAKFAQNSQACLLQCRIVIIVDAVHADHGATSFKEPAGKRKADETRGAGNQDGILRHRSYGQPVCCGLTSIIGATARLNRDTSRDRAATSRQAPIRCPPSRASPPAASHRARTGHAPQRRSPHPPAAWLPAA